MSYNNPYNKLASKMANHPDFLNLGERSRKKLAKKIIKQIRREKKNKSKT